MPRRFIIVSEREVSSVILPAFLIPEMRMVLAEVWIFLTPSRTADCSPAPTVRTPSTTSSPTSVSLRASWAAEKLAA